MTGWDWINKQRAIYTRPVTGEQAKWGVFGYQKPENTVYYKNIDKTIPHALFLVEAGEYIVLDVDRKSANEIVSKYLQNWGYEKSPRIKTTKGYHYIFRINNTYKHIRTWDKSKVKVLNLLGVEADYLIGSRIELLALYRLNKEGKKYFDQRELINFDQEIPELPLFLTPLISRKGVPFKTDQWERGHFMDLEPGHTNHDEIIKWMSWLAAHDFYRFSKATLTEWTKVCSDVIPNWSLEDSKKMIMNVKDISDSMGELPIPPDMTHVAGLFKFDRSSMAGLVTGVNDFDKLTKKIIKDCNLMTNLDDDQIFALDPRYKVLRPVMKLENTVGEYLYHNIHKNINPKVVTEITKALRYAIPKRKAEYDSRVIHFKNCDYQIGKGIINIPVDAIRINQNPHRLISDEEYNSPAYKDAIKQYDEVFDKWTSKDPGTKQELEEMNITSMTKYMHFDKIWILLGDGSNGKSSYLMTLACVLGDWNISHQDLGHLTSNNFSSANLYSKIANINYDISSEFIKDPSIVKNLSSGDYISAERKNQDPFMFRSHATLIFSANVMPHLKELGSSSAIDRRLKFITFINELKADAKVNDLYASLKEEKFLEVFVYRAVKAGDKLFKRGKLFTSKRSQAKWDEYYREMNSVADWFNSCRETIKDGTLISELQHSYRLWADKMKITRPLKHHTFIKQLSKVLKNVGWIADIEKVEVEGESMKQDMLKVYEVDK